MVEEPKNQMADAENAMRHSNRWLRLAPHGNRKKAA